MHVRDSLTSLRHETNESTLCSYTVTTEIAFRVSGTITANTSRDDHGDTHMEVTLRGIVIRETFPSIEKMSTR